MPPLPVPQVLYRITTPRSYYCVLFLPPCSCGRSDKRMMLPIPKDQPIIFKGYRVEKLQEDQTWLTLYELELPAYPSPSTPEVG